MTRLSLPPVGLGTANIGDFEQCAQTVADAIEMGYRHVDTAQMYENEEAVGAGIERAAVPREDLIVATKILPDNLAPEDVKTTAHESLDRLGLDSVEMLYVHWPMSAYDPEETLSAFQDLYDDGVMDYLCVSNFTPELLDEAADILDAPIAAHQVECHPLLPQDELLEYAREHDHYLVGYSPLAGGEILDDPLLTEIAEKHGISTAEVCLAWAFEQEPLIPIPKGVGDHVRANLEAQELELDAEDFERIDDYDERTRVIDPDAAAWNQ